MRVAVMSAPGEVRVEDRPEPTILERTDAIIRLAATCICGADLWPYRGVEAIDEPRPMGHEYAGIVEEVGSEVTTVQPGQFVIGSFFASDNTCAICRAGYQSSCVRREAAAPDGAQAERMRVPLADGTLVATPGMPDTDLMPPTSSTGSGPARSAPAGCSTSSCHSTMPQPATRQWTAARPSRSSSTPDPIDTRENLMPPLTLTSPDPLPAAAGPIPNLASPRARLTSGLVATVVFLTAIAPLATDMYVPAFPHVADDLATGATQVQLTLTTFFVGMALGQLIGGPVSDHRGRRRLLIAAILVMTLASVVCALTPSIGIMATARFVQGFSGGWAMVIGRAVVVDLATGARLVRVLNVIAAVGGIAPVVGPLLGGLILQLSHWRVSFWVVAALGLAMTLCVLLAVPETLPARRRHGGGIGAFVTAGRQVLRQRRYVGYLVVSGSAMGALFAYVATSAFVLQSMNGMSPFGYSIDFAANAAGMTLTALIAARLAGSISTRLIILAGQIAALGAGVVVLISAIWFDTPVLVAIVCFFVLMSAQGLIVPNSGALASAEVPDHPGTGSALLGFVQWVAAGTIAPIAGLGGQHTAVPMALLMVGGAATSLVGLLVIARPGDPTLGHGT